jgi:hypothetical protein
VAARLQHALRALDPDQRLAGGAAIALLVTLFLPWYDATVVERGVATSPGFNAFGVFSFVEAAVMLVAAGCSSCCSRAASAAASISPGATAR